MMLRWLRSPVVHFVVIGGSLFALQELWPDLYGRPPLGHERTPIVISVDQIRQLQSDFVRQWGSYPSSGQLKALIQQAIDDELLLREARRLALDLGDRSIRKRLVQKMRAVSANPFRNEEDLHREALALGLDDDLVIQRLLRQKMRILLQQEDPNEPPIQKKDVLDYIERHRDRFVQPATVTFSHIFLSVRAHGSGLEEKAEAVLAQLRSRSLQTEAAAALSDPFLLGQRFQARSQNGIAHYFGASFADQIFSLEPGTWSGPIASPYGLHLVWVHEKVSEKMRPLEPIWQQAAYAVLEERAADRLARGLRNLRSLYYIRIEGRGPDFAQGG